MNTKYVVGALLIAGVVAVVSILHQTPTTPVAPIKIGLIGPLSGDGAAWGVIEKNVMELAVDEVNTAGGINGRRIEVAYEDGRCEGTTGLSAAKKLVEVDGIKILFVSCSQEMQSIAPYAQAHKVIAWTSYASASTITHAGDYIFRNSYSNIDMAQAMATQALKKGKRVAIITEHSAFASDLEHFFVQDVPAGGGAVVAQEIFEQGTRDMRTQITKLLASKPDVVVLNPNGRDTGLAILKQLSDQGYQGPLVGNFFGGSRDVQLSTQAQGMVYVSDPVFVESPLKQKVFAAYIHRYEQPDMEWPVGSRYDAIYILKDALLAVGDDPTKLKDYLHHMPKAFTGILGTYRFDANDADITNVQPSIAKIQNFISVPVK